MSEEQKDLFMVLDCYDDVEIAKALMDLGREDGVADVIAELLAALEPSPGCLESRSSDDF